MNEKQPNLDENLEVQKEIDMLNDKKEEILEVIDTVDGLAADKFDIKDDIKDTSISDEDLNEKEGVFVKYTLKANEVMESLKKFQKLTIYKRNYIYTFLLIIIFFSYMFNFMDNQKDSMGMFLGIISIAVIALVWYTPLSHVKKMGKAIEQGEELEFTLTVYDNCLKTGEGENALIIDYDKYKITPFETIDAYNIGVGKERVFVIPKRCISDVDKANIEKILKNRFLDKYKSLLN